MELNKEEISNRLRSWSEKRYKRMKDLAFDLGMKPQAFQSSYLSGRSIPGPDLLMKLKNLGCDITWLLTGETSEKKYNDKILQLEVELKYYKNAYENLTGMILKTAENKVDYKPSKGKENEKEN